MVMPVTALIRNLATMTRVGVVAPGSEGTATAVARLGDAERIRRARVHPIAMNSPSRTSRLRSSTARVPSGKTFPTPSNVTDANGSSSRHRPKNGRQSVGC